MYGGKFTRASNPGERKVPPIRGGRPWRTATLRTEPQCRGEGCPYEYVSQQMKLIKRIFQQIGCTRNIEKRCSICLIQAISCEVATVLKESRKSGKIDSRVEEGITRIS